MSTAFKTGKKKGQYWNSLNRAIEVIHKTKLDIKTKDERRFEDRISGALQQHFDNFIDQRNTQQVITRVTCFGYDHRPDMSIGTDGIAIEVKLVDSGSKFREAIGQAMLYRTGYRFVIVLWIDISKEKVTKQLLEDEYSIENAYINELESLNIFGIIK